jgi:hypothetical protein
MPCRSDYMEPNDRELNQKLVGQLLIYVLASLHRPIPKEYIIAATHSYGEGVVLEKDVPKLCSILKSLNREQLNDVVYDARNKDARKLADWWEEHQEADRKREAEEEAEKKRKKIAKQALAKLTKEEKEALGL